MLAQFAPALGVALADVINTPEFMTIRAKSFLYMGRFDKVRNYL